MKAQLQKFGGAMFTPVLFFTAFGIIVALSTVFKNPLIVGSIANEGTWWFNLWTTVGNGASAVLNNLELLFVACLPLGLAKKAHGRAVVETLVIYLTFITIVSNILQFYGDFFGINFNAEGVTGVKAVAGIRTLDTGIIGAIVVASIVVYIHNRYFEKKLPEFLGIFQGSAFVSIIGFFVMLLLAVVTCLVWPRVQLGINSLQEFIKTTGILGVGIFSFLERFLIPTGLHHFVYQPFWLGPAVVEEGIYAYYLGHMQEFANSSKPLIELFPEGGFGITGNTKLFAPIGIGAAFYFTALPENKKKVLALLIPVILTAMVAGVTEPLEFMFLFISPVLWFVYSLLAGIMAMVMYSFGVVGWGNNLISLLSMTWIPQFPNHWSMVLTQIGLGLVFIVIYFFVFRFIILKFNLATPGRELITENATDTTTAIKETKINSSNNNPYKARAIAYLDAFGGKENIDTVNNCATRLRIKVKDETKVKPDEAFKKWDAHGVVRSGKNFQVIVGLDVQNVRTEFDELVE